MGKFKFSWPITILLVINLILLCFDLASTLRLGELIPYLESNPLYYYGGMTSVFIFNLILFGGLWYWYSRTQNIPLRYNLIFIFVLTALIRVSVINVNDQVYQEMPPTAENLKYVQSIPQEQLQQNHIETIKSNALLSVLPMLTTMITGLFFFPDHKVEVKQ